MRASRLEEPLSITARPARRSLLVLAFILVCTSGALPVFVGAADRLPDRLSDQEFWRLVSEFAEPSGSFRSDNLLSNELGFPHVIPALLETAKTASVYLGVGPEQNFTYIAALQPKMAFIIDLRRGNRDLHLMYKALFELSANRADFVARLFSKDRVEGLSRKATPREIFQAYGPVESSEELYRRNLKAIQDHLALKHRFPLSAEELQGVEYVYRNFFTFGPAIQYSSSAGGFGSLPNYVQLMVATDMEGRARSYLATEESFSIIKRLQARNLIVPIVGNFSGPKAIRSVAAYLKDHGAVVSAFYLSNVEMYLGRYPSTIFCDNVASLPLDPTSTFVRSLRGGRIGPGVGMTMDLGAIVDEVKDCASIIPWQGPG